MKKKGIGIGSMLYIVGYGFSRPDQASAVIAISQDGSVFLNVGIVEYGQGSTTGLSQIAAETLGVEVETIRIIHGDSHTGIDSGATSASRSMFVSGNAVMKAAAHLKESLLEMASEMLGEAGENLIAKCGKIYPKGKPESSISMETVASLCHQKGKRCIGFGYHNVTTQDLDLESGQGDTIPTYGFATQLAEVEVDTKTGWVDVLRFVSVNDAGKVINPTSFEGQVEGGISMGMGYVLYENFSVEKGYPTATSFTEYILPTAMDMPDVEILSVEDAPDPRGPFGAKGVGEAATVPPPAAILNAIYNAVGVRITDLPVTPEKVFTGLLRKGEEVK